jgi:hypothetical protein
MITSGLKTFYFKDAKTHDSFWVSFSLPGQTIFFKYSLKIFSENQLLWKLASIKISFYKNSFYKNNFYKFARQFFWFYKKKNFL